MVVRRLEQAMPNVYLGDRWVVIVAMVVDRMDYGWVAKDDIKLKMSQKNGQVALGRVILGSQTVTRFTFRDLMGMV